MVVVWNGDRDSPLDISASMAEPTSSFAEPTRELIWSDVSQARWDFAGRGGRRLARGAYEVEEFLRGDSNSR